jgi:hypothetical protein
MQLNFNLCFPFANLNEFYTPARDWIDPTVAQEVSSWIIVIVTMFLAEYIC